MKVKQQKIFNKELPLFGGWTSISHPSITEIFSQMPFDFIGIDIEHSTISLEQAQRIIAASQAKDIACFPRIGSHNGEQIKRLLDSGADGIIVPMVNTRSEVQSIIEWCKYPPIGKRSYGIARAQDYGFGFESYTQTWNDYSTIIIQIESIQGVEAAEDLLSNEYIDGAMIGPYDLSGSMGLPGELSHPKVQKACSHVLEVCQRHNKACGTQIIDPSKEAIQTALQAGYTFLVMASDIFVLWKWAEKTGQLIKTHKINHS